MATATQKTEHVPLPVQYEERVTGVTLDLSVEEAQLVRDILGGTVYNTFTSSRLLLLRSVLDAFQNVGITRKESYFTVTSSAKA